MKLVTASSEGRVLLLRFARPGEMLALAEAVLGPGPYGCSAVVAEPSLLAVIPRDTFIRFISSFPEACLALTLALSKQYDDIVILDADELSRLSAPAQVTSDGDGDASAEVKCDVSMPLELCAPGGAS